jgi:hypothetical protein
MVEGKRDSHKTERKHTYISDTPEKVWPIPKSEITLHSKSVLKKHNWIHTIDKTSYSQIEIE